MYIEVMSTGLGHHYNYWDHVQGLEHNIISDIGTMATDLEHIIISDIAHVQKKHYVK